MEVRGDCFLCQAIKVLDNKVGDAIVEHHNPGGKFKLRSKLELRLIDTARTVESSHQVIY
jgi:hypothetical protein